MWLKKTNNYLCLNKTVCQICRSPTLPVLRSSIIMYNLWSYLTSMVVVVDIDSNDNCETKQKQKVGLCYADDLGIDWIIFIFSRLIKQETWLTTSGF